MLSETQQSSRSPTASVQSTSLRSAPSKGISGQSSPESSIAEEQQSQKTVTPPVPPLFSSTYSKPKMASVSSKNSSSSASTSKSAKNNVNQSKINNNTSFKPVNVQRIVSNGKSKSDKKTIQEIAKVLGSNESTSASYIRVSARDIENELIPTSVLKYIQGGKSNRSVFEKIDTHSGRIINLGSGSYSDLENCISSYIPYKRYHRSYVRLSPKYDCYPVRSYTRASIFDDYSYDGILSSDYYRPSSYRTSSYKKYYYDTHYTRPATDLSLDEIREVNDTLSRYGIPVFTHHETHHNYHHAQPKVGDLISAYRTLMADPRLATYTTGNQAVHHVWDAVQHQPSYSSVPSYPAPGGFTGAPQLYNPPPPTQNQPQSIISRLFSGQQQQAPPPPAYPPPSSYPPPPPPPPPPGYPSAYPPPPTNNSQSVISRLFGGGSH